jgi:hypothetical protein
MEDLRKRFPSNFWMVAMFLAERNFAMFERVAPGDKQPVKHLSMADIIENVDVSRSATAPEPAYPTTPDIVRPEPPSSICATAPEPETMEVEDCPINQPTTEPDVENSPMVNESPIACTASTSSVSSCTAPAYETESEPEYDERLSFSPLRPSPRTPKRLSLDSNGSLEMSDLAKMKGIVDLCSITADGDIPKAAEFRKVMHSHPNLTIQADNKQIKSMNGFAIEKRNKLRTEVIVHDCRRSLHLPDLEKRMEDQLKQRNWYTKKLFDAVLFKSKKTLASRNEESRVAVVQRSKEETEKLAQAIKTQYWPLLTVIHAGDMGRGVVANKKIPKDTVVCDYHGELLDERTGRQRYEVEYKDRTDNCYMFMFEFEGSRYYVDAVKQCPCYNEHARRIIKGRLLNNSRTNPNIKVKPARINGNITLLMIAKREIDRSEMLVFNYKKLP